MSNTEERRSYEARFYVAGSFLSVCLTVGLLPRPLSLLFFPIVGVVVGKNTYNIYINRNSIFAHSQLLQVVVKCYIYDVIGK